MYKSVCPILAVVSLIGVLLGLFVIHNAAVAVPALLLFGYFFRQASFDLQRSATQRTAA